MIESVCCVCPKIAPGSSRCSRWMHPEMEEGVAEENVNRLQFLTHSIHGRAHVISFGDTFCIIQRVNALVSEVRHTSFFLHFYSLTKKEGHMCHT